MKGYLKKTLALKPALAQETLAQEPIYLVQLVEERVFFKWELATRGTEKNDRSSKVDGMRMRYVS